MATLGRVSLLMPFTQQYLLTSCLSITFHNSQNLKHFHCYCVCYSDLWSEIFDVIVLGHPNLCPYKTANLTHKWCVFWLLHLSLSLSSGHPIPWDNFEIKPINNPTMTTKCSSKKKKSCISLTLTWKLETISKEGTSKPRKAKTRPLGPNSSPSCEYKAKVLQRFLQVLLQWTDEW